MFKKKKRLVVPEGDDYADDAGAYSTRRDLSREARVRHFRVREFRGGDPRQVSKQGHHAKPSRKKNYLQNLLCSGRFFN